MAANVTNGTGLISFARMISQSPDAADACAALFGALRLSAPLTVGNSVLVTSTGPAEGKTTVATCLAITASSAGQSALLIDGDLRRPSLTSLIGIRDVVGLIELLLGQAEATEAIHPVAALSDWIPAGAIKVMTGGRKSAVVLPAVDWSVARTRFKSATQAFGIVLLDSPPILAANDALLLAGLVDAVVLVVGAGSANIDEVRQARKQLEPIGTPVIGAVLNKFEPRIHGPPIQPYRGYYRNYNNDRSQT